ncbi:MAG: peptide ABC transporter substrate-binding protein [Clostridiales bacterium]|nr:peptide ABC transporter substrate-binding protein [Clostridiales bacterium]
MKKALAMMLAMIMVFSMVACAKTEPEETASDEASKAPVVVTDDAEVGLEEEEEVSIQTSGEGGGFTIAPLYFYTNKYCLKEGIDNLGYTSLGYFFFFNATGKEELNLCIASEPETIDPGLVASVDGSTYSQHQFEGLMKYVSTNTAVGDDPSLLNYQIAPGMAESYTSKTNEDGTITYTFTLRDALWSDGQPVTAADFEYAWKRIVNPETASDYGYILDGIVVNAAEIQAGEKTPDELGVVAVDEKTLDITILTECPYFIELCAFSSLMPLRQDVVEANGTAWTDPANIVVNGPYKATEWVHDSVIVMEKNANYYDVEALGPEKINWYLSDSETAILQSYKAGDFDFIETFPADEINPLKESGDCFVVPYVGTYYIYLNCENIPDWRARAAITLVIDREHLVTNVTQAGEVPATGMVAAGIQDSTKADFAAKNSEGGVPSMYKWLQENCADPLGLDLNNYEDCCELATILLEQAVADGFDVSKTLYYCYNTSDSHQVIAEAVQSDVANVLGMNMELTNQDWNVYTNGLAEGTFGVARLGWIADYNDPVTYLELFTNGNSYNYGLWVSDEYTDLIASAKALGGGAERDAILYEAEIVLFSGTMA